MARVVIRLPQCPPCGYVEQITHRPSACGRHVKTLTHPVSRAPNCCATGDAYLYWVRETRGLCWGVLGLNSMPVRP